MTDSGSRNKPPVNKPVQQTTPEAVFFDLDGTLIDTAADMGGALNRMLIKRKRPTVSAEDYRSSVSHGSIALLKLGFPELDPSTEMHDLRLEFLATYAEDVASGSHLFPGVDKLLDTLVQYKLPWGIITNKPEAPTLTLLNELNLPSRCCSIVAADTTTHAKPHPAPMRFACQRASVDPSKCFYVGDAERDIAAGRAVEMQTFVACWGYIDSKTDDTSTWGADIHLLQPTDLLEYIAVE